MFYLQPTRPKKPSHAHAEVDTGVTDQRERLVIGTAGGTSRRMGWLIYRDAPHLNKLENLLRQYLIVHVAKLSVSVGAWNSVSLRPFRKL